MVSLLAYKVSLLILLAVTGTFAVASAYYLQLRTNELNNEILRTSGEASSKEAEINSLNARIQTLEQQLSALQTSNSQFDVLVQQLREEIAELRVLVNSLQGLSGDVLIGAILPVTGELSFFGEASREAIHLARDDVNSLLEQSGAGWSVKLLEADDATNPVTALQKLQLLHSSGVGFVVGPQFSGAVRTLKDYANANKIVIVSQSSTAPDLGVSNDYIFRFAPNDTAQSSAIARTVIDSGVKVAVLVYRGDAWGDGVSQAVRTAIIAKGGTVHTVQVRYDPISAHAGNVVDFVDTLNAEVSSLIASRPASEVGVVLASFEEAVYILAQAGNHASLRSVRWFGSDGTVQSGRITNNPTAAQFAVDTNFVNPLFAATKSDRYYAVFQRISAVLGREPDNYALAAYDAVWVIALSLILVDKYDAETVRGVLPQVAETYFGVSGALKLNAAGDRFASDSGLWLVTPIPTGWEWAEVGIYSYVTDSIHYG